MASISRRLEPVGGADRNVPRAPLLWILIPQIAGIALARAYPAVSPWLLVGIAAIALLLPWACGGLRPAPAGAGFFLCWAVGIAVGCMALSWAWSAAHVHAVDRDPELWADRPPREVSLVLDVEHLFPAAPGEASPTRAGVAVIHRAPARMENTTGARVFFRLRDADPPFPAAGIERPARGVLLHLENEAWQSWLGMDAGFRQYLRSRGVSFVIVRGAFLGPGRPAGWLNTWLARTADRLRAILGGGDGGPASRILLAMIMGESAALADEQETLFRRTGTMHFFAISGLHIGIIATCIAGILRALGTPWRVRPWIGLPVLFLYVAVTGFSESAVRAFLMVAVFALAVLVLRKPRPLASLVASAVLVLAIDPFQLFRPGFQLSYGVVAAILLYGLPLAERLRENAAGKDAALIPGALRMTSSFQRVRDALRDSFAISLAAFLVSTPLTAAYFGILSPLSFLLNIPLVFLAFGAVAAGAAAVVCGLAGLGFIVGLPLAVAHACIWIMTLLSQAVYRIPGAWVAAEPAGWPLPAAALGFSTLCFCLLHTRIARRGRRAGSKTRDILFVLSPFGIVVFVFARMLGL